MWIKLLSVAPWQMAGMKWMVSNTIGYRPDLIAGGAPFCNRICSRSSADLGLSRGPRLGHLRCLFVTENVDPSNPNRPLSCQCRVVEDAPFVGMNGSCTGDMAGSSRAPAIGVGLRTRHIPVPHARL